MERQRLDFKSLVKVTSFVQSALWNKPLQSTTINDDLRSIIKEKNLDANLETFCRTFCALSFLPIPEVLETHREDLSALLAQIWDRITEMEHQYLWNGQPWFANFTYRCMELGGQTFFLIIYSECFAKYPGEFCKAFDDNTKVTPSSCSSARGHPSRCMWRYFSH